MNKKYKTSITIQSLKPLAKVIFYPPLAIIGLLLALYLLAGIGLAIYWLISTLWYIFLPLIAVLIVWFIIAFIKSFFSSSDDSYVDSVEPWIW